MEKYAISENELEMKYYCRHCSNIGYNKSFNLVINTQGKYLDEYLINCPSCQKLVDKITHQNGVFHRIYKNPKVSKIIDENDCIREVVDYGI